MPKLLLIPLEDTVVFPNMTVTLTVDAGDDEQVLLVPRHENEYASVGTVAEVLERVRLPGGVRAVALNGLHRAASAPPRATRPAACAPTSRSAPTRRLRRAARASSSRSTAPSSRRSSSCAATTAASPSFVRSITEPGALADTAGYSPDLTFEQKVELLEAVDVIERLQLALRFQRDRLAEMQVRKRIREDVESGAQKQQREYFLRKQMESIRKELGEDEGSVIEEYRTKIEEAEHAGGRARAGRPRADPPRVDGRGLGRGLDDPHVPRLADRRAVGQAAPRRRSTPCTRARSSTPTTPASTT